MNTSSAYREEITQMTRKGQVTVPAAIRKALDLQEGDKVAFSVADAKERRVTLTPVPSVVDRTFGSLASSVPMLSAQEEHLAFSEGVAEEVAGEGRK